MYGFIPRMRLLSAVSPSYSLVNVISGPVLSGRPPGLVACPLVPGTVLAPPTCQVPVVEVIDVTLAPRDDLLLKVGLLLPSTSLVTVSRLYLLILLPQLGWPARPSIFGRRGTLCNPGVYSIAVFSVQCAVTQGYKVQYEVWGL